MAVKEILQLGNPVLWDKSIPVDDVFSEETKSLIRDLDDTLSAFYETHGFGRAIAAPQIGVLKQVIFVRMQPSGFCGPLINPEITWVDRRQIEMWDDCFSFPDLLELYVETNSLQIYTYNLDTKYDHTCQVRIGIVSKDEFIERYLPSRRNERLESILDSLVALMSLNQPYAPNFELISVLSEEEGNEPA